MQIEIKSKNFLNNKKAESSIVDILTFAVNDFLGEQYTIEKIIVTDDSSHGKEIEKIQSQYNQLEGFTNNNGNLAIAKVITNCDKKSSIIFHDCHFNEILGEKSSNPDEWNSTSQLYYYVIFHELAHCIDDQKRVAIYSTQEFKRSKFSLEQIKQHYICTLLSEFSACVLSSRRMSGTVFSNLIESTISECDDYLVGLEKTRKQHFNGTIEIVDIAYQSAQIFWVILTQFSKLIGSTINTERNFSFEQLPTLPKSKINISTSLLELNTVLKKLWVNYPVWSSSSAEPLNLIFRNITAENGYTFAGDSEHNLMIIQ